MNMGMETMFPGVGEILEGLFLYLLIPVAIPLLVVIITSFTMPHVGLRKGIGMGSLAGFLTFAMIVLIAWYVGLSDVHFWLMQVGIPAPYYLVPLLFSVAGAFVSWWLIRLSGQKVAAGG